MAFSVMGWGDIVVLFVVDRVEQRKERKRKGSSARPTVQARDDVLVPFFVSGGGSMRSSWDRLPPYDIS